MKIKEVIVVEGKDDVAAVKAAVDCEVITTSGYAFGGELMKTLRQMEKRCGVIILTDPDYMGTQIRKRIAKGLNHPKHAFLPQNQAIKKEDIGVENASPEDIRKALEGAKAEMKNPTEEFTKADLRRYGLTGTPDATRLRDEIGRELGIGFGNAKQFLHRLNHFGITREEFEAAWEEVTK